jgi:hypothetical protein
VDEIAYVRLRQIASQHHHGAQVKLVFRHRLVEQRELPRRAGRVEPLVGRAFGVMQVADQEIVHRRIAFRAVQLTCVDLADAGEHDGGGPGASVLE